MLISVSRKIACETKYLCQRIWDTHSLMTTWPALQAIETYYEDSLHQEIVMWVDRDGILESNRTIRFLFEGKKITFFSAVPPPMMSFHRGEWVFEEGKVGCYITANREFELIRKEEETKENFQERCRIFSLLFQERLKKILDEFGALTS